MALSTLMICLRVGRSNAGVLAISADLAKRSVANHGMAARSGLDSWLCPRRGSVRVERLRYAQVLDQAAAAEQEFRAALSSWRDRLADADDARSAHEYVPPKPGARTCRRIAEATSGRCFHPGQAEIGDLLMRLGRPILTAAAGRGGLCVCRALVCFKEAREARRALADALPLFRRWGASMSWKSSSPGRRGTTEAARRSPTSRPGSNDMASRRPARRSGRSGVAQQLAAIARDLDGGLIVAGDARPQPTCANGVRQRPRLLLRSDAASCRRTSGTRKSGQGTRPIRDFACPAHMDTPAPDTPAATRGLARRVRASPFAVVWLASAVALVGISMYDTASGWLMTTLDLDPLTCLARPCGDHPADVPVHPARGRARRHRRSAPADPVHFLRDRGPLVVAFAGLVSLDLASPLSLLATTFLLSAAWSVNRRPGSPSCRRWCRRPTLPARSRPTASPTISAGRSARRSAARHRPLRTLRAVLGVRGARTSSSSPRSCGGARPPKETASLPAERLTGAIRTGFRHALNNRAVPRDPGQDARRLSVRGGLFGPDAADRARRRARASALRPASQRVSAGALASSFVHRSLRRFLDLDQLVPIGSIGTAAALALFGLGPAFWVLLGASFCGGAAWVVVLTSLYVSAQNVLPQWVRGRGLAIFLTVTFGSSPSAARPGDRPPRRSGSTTRCSPPRSARSSPSR